MTRHISDTELDDELTNAGRTPRLTEGVLAALHDVVASSARGPASRRRRWWIVAASIIAAVIAVPVAAGAIGSWTAHTGEFGGSGTEVIDRSEWIGLDADDAPEVIVSLYDDSLPLPDGASRDDVIAPVAALLAEMGQVPDGETGHVGMQETTIQGMFERAARCLWFREWLDADSSDSGERRDAATEGIQGSTSWPITVASDGGGVVELLEGEAAAAAAGDRRGVIAAYGGCANFYGEVAR